MNNYKSLPNPAQSAPDHHFFKTHPLKTRPKYVEIIQHLLQNIRATLCNQAQPEINNITRHATRVLGEIQGKTKKDGGPSRVQSQSPTSHIVLKRQRGVVFFPPNFRFPNPVFNSGERFSWLYLCLGLRLIKGHFRLSQKEKSLREPDWVSVCGNFKGWF